MIILLPRTNPLGARKNDIPEELVRFLPELSPGKPREACKHVCDVLTRRTFSRNIVVLDSTGCVPVHAARYFGEQLREKQMTSALASKKGLWISAMFRQTPFKHLVVPGIMPTDLPVSYVRSSWMATPDPATRPEWVVHNIPGSQNDYEHYINCLKIDVPEKAKELLFYTCAGISTAFKHHVDLIINQF